MIEVLPLAKQLFIINYFLCIPQLSIGQPSFAQSIPFSLHAFMHSSLQPDPLCIPQLSIGQPSFAQSIPFALQAAIHSGEQEWLFDLETLASADIHAA